MAYETINPYTEELLKTFENHTDVQLQQIIAQADETYRNTWSLKSLPERKVILKKAAALLREQIDEFAAYVTLEMGKLFKEAKGEVELSADILDYYADNAEAFLAPVKLAVSEGEAYTESAPLGVLFCVEPWNFPYYQLARVAGPNLMLGNTLIVKHSPNVPQCALAFEKLFIDAGAPVGADNHAPIVLLSRSHGTGSAGSKCRVAENSHLLAWRPELPRRRFQWLHCLNYLLPEKPPELAAQ
jgi:succinate-semialdehyde dehydrogenase/glutarate-semialdehyde dehydrogenase